MLHVGHLKGGRNIDKLVNVSNQYHIILVVSSVTEAEKDAGIRKQLETRGNVTIIDSYLENHSRGVSNGRFISVSSTGS